VEEGAGAEGAVVEVQRVTAGDDRLVAQQAAPRVGAKQGQRQPPLPGEQPQEQDEPETVIAGLGRRRRLAFHRGPMVAKRARANNAACGRAGAAALLDSIPPPVRMALDLQTRGTAPAPESPDLHRSLAR